MLAGRYQIVGKLGEGGMGEIYRANDLTLDQPVALKFLPATMSANPSMLARFHSEVRVARQVSHPNVCRVYDIGEVDQQLFLSMEYVDGEDLGSLLRRIGRLPIDKGVEFARKLCAGLAAAHEKGVIHRDLKPANIMIDSQGQVLIMDFGLAGAAEEMIGAEISAGTPGYMAPEQLAGREVTARSDIYALGLVLYEMFTGRRPFEGSTLAEMIRLQEHSTPPSLTTVVKELDPVVERVILRCLEADPRNRPGSALAVAAALPGGDPLAAALAAGETPSPALVAASGTTASIRPWKAFALLGVVAAALLGTIIVGPMAGLVGNAPLELPPDALAQKAREHAASFGYSLKPVSVARGYAFDMDALRYVEREVPGGTRLARIQAGQPPAIYFWYRQSPQYMEPGKSLVTPDDPPLTTSGMIFERLDTEGRLHTFIGVPPQVDDPSPPGLATDWNMVLRAAGFDPARVTPVPSTWTPPVYADSRIAWQAPMAGSEGDPLRIEAAAWRGKPVYFSVIGPWTRPTRMQAFTASLSARIYQIVVMALLVSVLIGAILLSRHNVKRNRSDRAGANRLAIFFGLVYIGIWLLNGWHVPTSWEFNTAFRAVSYAVFWMASVWVGYVAIEPFVRRHWPQALVSWTRLLAGGISDRLVGRDALIGVAAGCVFALLSLASTVVERPYGVMPRTDIFPFILLGARNLMGAALIAISNTIVQVLVAFFVLFLMRSLLRREWLVAPVYIGWFALIGMWDSSAPVIDVVFSLALSALTYAVITRVGFLAMLVALYVQFLLIESPLTNDFSLWYAGPTIFAALLVSGMAAYGASIAIKGTDIIRDELL
jgi:serine/threonine-protein kinase